ncbi:5-oxoprolinase subunit C family protein [Nonlabens ulvanivorans]|uniref:5-oxoprolinase subunit C family protein n=1 Tax=Nonlabens ulvanivorans TaxID=906888 RepID=UPI002941C703|nr:biotin-dependent carboxyltransferase family protein [Nonlabens ulvanivorans]WOI23289.1 biotin-dependent carboxyltransferase family protein [Nonlabens ulvanivorans]
MARLTILSSGFNSTIQDMGRLDYREYGVPHSGAIDQDSSRLANRLLNNRDDDAVIEMTLLGAEIIFSEPTQIAITGAYCKIVVQCMGYESPCVIAVKTGDVVKIGPAIRGNFIYMSIKEGFQSEESLGSQSYYPHILDNALLKKGDHLSYHRAEKSIDQFDEIPSNLNASLKAYAGPEFHLLNRKQQEQLLGTSFTISKLWNRMAFQLEETLVHTLSAIKSSPVLPGTIQLTPDGKLIVLMRDAQTTGGYPRVLQLTEEAVNIISQKRVGEALDFIIKN